MIVATCPVCDCDRPQRFDSTFIAHVDENGIECPASGETQKVCDDNRRPLRVRLNAARRRANKKPLAVSQAISMLSTNDGVTSKRGGVRGFVWKGRWRKWCAAS